MQKKYTILSKQRCYSGFLKLDKYRLTHELYQGGESQPLTRELLERGHAVAVLLYDPQTDEVVLTEQFRIGALKNPEGAWILEIVAGMIDEGESAISVAQRETFEETGCTLLDLIKIGVFLVSPGGCSETITLFCGRVDSTTAKGIHGLIEEGEEIKVVKMSFNQALEKVESGIINTYSSVVALQWLHIHKKHAFQTVFTKQISQ